MTINVTWPNIYKLVALVMAIVTIVLATGSALIEHKMRALDVRLEERWKIYQSDRIEIRQRIQRLEESNGQR